jgi:EmrB/QacA subfamily drug resistance transporter
MQVNAPATQRTGGLEYKWVVAFVVVIGVFMSILDQTIVNIAIPSLQTAFGADLHDVQWVLTGYILTQGVFTPTAAYFANTLGTKRFYIICLTAFTLGSALCGLAWSLPILIFFRVLQGAGGAALFPLSITMLYSEFPPNERGIAIGFFGIPALLAPAIGPTLGGYLVTYVGWRAIFYINVPFGILGVLLVLFLIRESPTVPGLRFDILGFLFAGVGLALTLYGLSDASTDGWGSAKVIGSLAGGLLILAIFVTIELIQANSGGQPLLDLRLFRNGPFSTSMIANVFVTFSLFGGIFLLPIYLQSIRGLSAFQSGLLLLPQALASMLSVLVGGRLVDRIGVRAVVIPGLILLGIGTWLLTTTTLYSPFWWLQVVFILRGLGLGLCIQPLTVSALAEIPPRQLAQGSSISTVIRSVSSSLGIAVLATLVQTQGQVHFARLAEQVTPSSQAGQLLLEIQAYFVSQGADLLSAKSAAYQIIAGLITQQAFMLSFQNAFSFSLVVVVLAIIAVFLVRESHLLRRTRPQQPLPNERAESLEEAEALPLVFAE